ncbi:MAG: phosphotransferase [Planctomycetes bacterium]|nr:phosphotransferase [Planctomycetota bacterium]
MPSATENDAAIVSRIAASLPTARWFADKGVAVERVVLHDRVSLPGTEPIVLAIAAVHLAGGDSPQSYAVVVGPDGADAAATPQFARWLIDTALTEHEVPGRAGGLVGHCVKHPEPAVDSLPMGTTTVAPIGGDASNSSFIVRCGSMAAVVKLLRRCRQGIHPEVEIGNFFASQAPWQGVPRLRGWLEYAPTHDTPDTHRTPAAAPPIVIATVHEYAAGCTTAWDRLVGLLKTGGLAGGLAGAAGETAATLAAALGQATGHMHRALASRPDITAFAPEPATPANRQTAATRMVDHAADVFTLIASRLPRLKPAIAARLQGLQAAQSRLADRLGRFASLAIPIQNIRVHGDYHLGQVLVGEHDDRVLVIDFEGEPGRTLNERREKTSAAKDVAGMCRSFDYLLRHMAQTTGMPYAVADLQRLEASYLDAYRSIAEGHPWWPADRHVADALVAVFKLDKAIYELAYELNNRPDWIDVPLAAVEEAAAT